MGEQLVTKPWGDGGMSGQNGQYHGAVTLDVALQNKGHGYVIYLVICVCSFSNCTH